jgi:cytochrome c oxidase accessory protein FixG
MENTSSAYENFDDSFRDEFSAVDQEGKRNWFYPQKPSGFWHNRRVIFSVVALTLLFAGPFVKANGQPMFLFNIIERKIIVFGLFIGPQDYWLFGLAMVSFMVFVVLFTVVYGRLFCGWACPQTIFMEMVFRKIEYAIEGTHTQQKLLDKAPWTTDKIIKKANKWSIFMLISFVIANLLLSYVVGVDELKKIITEPLSEHLSLFGGIVGFTVVFYFVFAWARDQVCTVICPYGRLQGVLLDRDSMVVAYDYKRGEPREKLRKGQERTAGDCISCQQCVVVCPTGIDIRNGTQMECINCTACIDACDHIMDKVDLPRGLIRYASENSIAEGTKKLITPRVIGYSVVLALLWGVLGFMVVTRTDTETTLFRAPGTTFIQNPDGTVSNLYTFKIFNKTNHAIAPTLKLESPEGTLRFAGTPDLTLDPVGMSEGSVFITLPKSAIKGRKTDVKFSVYQAGKKIEEFKTSFIAPQ